MFGFEAQARAVHGRLQWSMFESLWRQKFDHQNSFRLVNFLASTPTTRIIRFVIRKQDELNWVFEKSSGDCKFRKISEIMIVMMCCFVCSTCRSICESWRDSRFVWVFDRHFSHILEGSRRSWLHNCLNGLCSPCLGPKRQFLQQPLCHRVHNQYACEPDLLQWSVCIVKDTKDSGPADWKFILMGGLEVLDKKYWPQSYTTHANAWHFIVSSKVCTFDKSISKRFQVMLDQRVLARQICCDKWPKRIATVPYEPAKAGCIRSLAVESWPSCSSRLAQKVFLLQMHFFCKWIQV